MLKSQQAGLSSSSTSGRCLIIHTWLSIRLLCTFLLAPERQSLLHQKGLREANFQRWEQKKQLPQNWGHSNGENKIQDIINKWSYMPKMMTMNICIPLIQKAIGMKMRKKEKACRPCEENAWSPAIYTVFLFKLIFVEVRAFSRRPV